MQRKEFKTFVLSAVKSWFNTVRRVDNKVMSSVLAVVMLVSTIGIVTKYYTLGYDVYYGDVNVGVISSKEEAMETYTEAVADVSQKTRSRLDSNISFVMTIASVQDIESSDLYRGIVEAAAGEERCYAIAAEGVTVVKLKTEAEAEAAISEYVRSFNRDDAQIYSEYKIYADKDIVTELASVEEATRRITRSGLFTVVYKNVVEEEVVIPHKKTVIEDENVPKGVEVCRQKGKDGLAIKREITFFENGVKKHHIDPVEEIIEEPVEAITVVGTGEMVGLVKDSLIWPCKGTFTSKFGPRWGRNHNGIDIAAPCGTSIHAPSMGVVTFSGTRNGYGNYIIIDHGNGYETTYAHLTERKVSTGDSVATGDLIGTVGITGNVTGAHLHFEIKKNGAFVDPMAYIAG